MKKVFYYCVVFFTFAVGMMSCSKTMGLYEDEGFDMKVAQRQFPVDYDQLANDLDSLGLLYGRDVIVYGVPDIEYQSVLRQTANVMRRIGEKEKNNTFVLITSDGIEKDSISGLRSIYPNTNEYVTEGSYSFKKGEHLGLISNVTVNWSNQGVSVSLDEGFSHTLRNSIMLVFSDYVSIGGEISVHDTPIMSNTLNNLNSGISVYAFSGLSNDEHSWEIHKHTNPIPLE